VQPLDVVCFYSDLGRPYIPLIENMTRSAKAVMPGCRTILLTPTPYPSLCKLFDYPVELRIETSLRTVCLDKARATITWQSQMDRPCVFIDPDVTFVKPVEFPVLADVGLLWRSTKPAQPVNSGMVLATPGNADFWNKYGSIAANLPHALHAWWCDQLAYSLLLGSMHYAGEMVSAYGANVKLIPEEDACAPPERAKDQTWAIHLKGKRKGPGFNSVFGSSAGTSSPASAS
jgi:hypothetical protein